MSARRVDDMAVLRDALAAVGGSDEPLAASARKLLEHLAGVPAPEALKPARQRIAVRCVRAHILNDFACRAESDIVVHDRLLQRLGGSPNELRYLWDSATCESCGPGPGGIDPDILLLIRVVNSQCVDDGLYWRVYGLTGCCCFSLDNLTDEEAALAKKHVDDVMPCWPAEMSGLRRVARCLTRDEDSPGRRPLGRKLRSGRKK